MKLETNTNNSSFDIHFLKLIAAVCLIFFVFAPVSTTAKTLAEYKEKVRQASDLTYVLLYPDEEDATTENSPNFERATLTKIRQSLPESEKIEWQGASIEVDNRWLAESIDALEKDSAKRTEILTGISERLDALAGKIEELENPPRFNQTKDEAKLKLTEILRGEEYQKLEKEAESIFQKIYRKVVEWLKSFFPQTDLSDSSASGFQTFSFVLQMLLYAAVLGVVGFLIYKFAASLNNQFRGKENLEKKERIILGEKLLPNQSAKDLFDEAERLAREGNLRAAIRKGYIALLCELGDRKIIGLSQNKTNRDYLRDVRGKTELHRNLSSLTVNFERHWYGFESVEEKDWENFRRDYQQVITAKH